MRSKEKVSSERRSSRLRKDEAPSLEIPGVTIERGQRVVIEPREEFLDITSEENVVSNPNLGLGV